MELKIEFTNKKKRLRYTDVESNILMNLDSITDMLYTLNTDMYSSFSDFDSEKASELSKDIEKLIDMVDNTYTDNIIKNICKRAVIDNLTMDEFDVEFQKFCSEIGIINSNTLIEVALSIFEEQKELFESFN